MFCTTIKPRATCDFIPSKGQDTCQCCHIPSTMQVSLKSVVVRETPDDTLQSEEGRWSTHRQIFTSSVWCLTTKTTTTTTPRNSLTSPYVFCPCLDWDPQWQRLQTVHFKKNKGVKNFMVHYADILMSILWLENKQASIYTCQILLRISLCMRALCKTCQEDDWLL